MCTVSWIHSNDGYQLLCNRDEKHTRSAAIPPKVEARGAVRFIAPIDPDFGGTWLSANECGLTVCLVNAPASSNLPAHATSRGALVLDLAGAPSLDALRECLEARSMVRFAPFVLVALEPQRRSFLCEWNGERLTIFEDGDQRMPLISSSVNYAEIRRWREEEFSRRVASAGVVDATVLWEFHSGHGPQGRPSAFTVCMHRNDAATVSFSWVNVRGEDVRFFYSPAAPCQWAPGDTVTLARKLN